MNNLCSGYFTKMEPERTGHNLSRAVPADSTLEALSRKDVLMARKRRTDANLAAIDRRLKAETMFAKMNDEQRIRTMSECMFKYGESVMSWVSGL